MSLSALEYSHGFINPFPHRAVTDVLSMLKIVSQYPTDRMIELAKSPTIKVIAKLQAPNWSNKKEVNEFNKIKNKVSQSKFKWEPSQKIWFRNYPKILIDENKVNLDFEWEILK